MPLDPPSYLSSLQNNIRARPIPWDGAVRAGHITEQDLKKIKSVDKVRKEQRKTTLEADLDGFKALLLGAEGERSVLDSAAKRGDVIQYILASISISFHADIANGYQHVDAPSLAETLLTHPEPYKPFVPLLSQSSNPEDPIPLLASAFLVGLLSRALNATSKPTTETESALSKLYSYLSTLANSSDSGLQDIAVQQYSAVLKIRRSREIFWEQRQETVDPLIEILRSAAGVSSNGEGSSTLWSGAASIRAGSELGLGGGVALQLLYHVLLVIWQLSFEGGLVGAGLEEQHEIIPLYTQLLRLSPKEKTSRLLLSTLYNLLSTNADTLLPAATLARLPTLLTNLSGRHITDPDLLEDLAVTKTLLSDYTANQTTFDEYAAEVRSGHLHWSPPHKNEAFWRENARRVIEEEKGELIKKLAYILGKAWEGEKQVLAVGCNDVGWLVKEVPEMRGRLEKAGLKARVLALMAEPDEGVKWESLRATGEWLRYSFDS